MKEITLNESVLRDIVSDLGKCKEGIASFLNVIEPAMLEDDWEILEPAFKKLDNSINKIESNIHALT